MLGSGIEGAAAARIPARYRRGKDHRAFGLHPLRVESVAWITERRDVLSGLFYLLTIWAYLRYVERRSRGAYWAAVGYFALDQTVVGTALPVFRT